MTIEGITGTALDARLKHAMLTDPVLQADLTSEEFRAFCNLLVFVVSLVSDGAFRPERACMVPHLKPADIDRFTELGLVECDDVGNCRIADPYWSWQSSRKDLEQLANRRRKNADRQAVVRSVSEKARDMVKACGIPAGKQTPMAKAVEKLLDDGVNYAHIEAALRKLAAKDNPWPEELAMLVRAA